VNSVWRVEYSYVIIWIRFSVCFSWIWNVDGSSFLWINKSCFYLKKEMRLFLWKSCIFTLSSFIYWYCLLLKYQQVNIIIKSKLVLILFLFSFNTSWRSSKFIADILKIEKYGYNGELKYIHVCMCRLKATNDRDKNDELVKWESMFYIYLNDSFLSLPLYLHREENYIYISDD
jgi:hypothetical protein